MSKEKGKPFYPNIEEMIALGFNPKTKLPFRWDNCNPNFIKEGLRIFFRLIDEHDAVNRFEWKNLPMNISSEEFERLLYYKGQLAFFKFKDLDEYYVMPYALDGTLDYYGRFNRIHPVPMNSGGKDEKGNGSEEVKYNEQQKFLSTIKLKCIYDAKQFKEDDDINSVCVLIHDYTKQISQTIIPRKTVNEPLIEVMSDIIPFLRTAMINATGIKGMRVNDADSSEEVDSAANKVYGDAISGKIWEAITSQIEFQELTDSKGIGKLQEFLVVLQSLDNLRLSGYGLDNGGVFEKKAHMLESEEEVNQSNVALVLEDGLQIRKNFCELVNKIYGLNIQVDVRDIKAGLNRDDQERKLLNKEFTTIYEGDKGDNNNA